ncbi:MAG: NAD(+)/NADH kinase [Spirochaetaceae bacterium]|jgi:NAD+ kinase|nr:NAD(+)/NADH kinase [Spirochaetaceae bacterium]
MAEAAVIKRALLFVNPKKPEAPALAEDIRGVLRGYGIEALSPEEGLAPGEADLAFSLGGDGTVLYAVRTVAFREIPVFPVNAGSLGFIAVIRPEEWREVFESYLEGRLKVSRRLMLDITVEREGVPVFSASCLNDGVISASGIAKLLRLGVECLAGGGLAGEGLAGGRERIALGRYRSDGLIVATPTGSTAYSVAAGGPILDPEIDALIINPICPFTLSNRPIVVPARETVIIDVEEEQRSALMLTVDGQVSLPLEPGDKVLFRRSAHDARLAASPRQGFYRALQSKLNWSGGGPHA